MFVSLRGKAWVQSVLSVLLWHKCWEFFSNNHDTFLGRENKFKRDQAYESGKLLLVKSVKEMSQTVIETFHLKKKIQVGRLKSKYDWQIKATTQG